MITLSQKKALKWFANRGGDGVFDKHQVLLAGGDSAPIMRATWNALEKAGLVEFYLDRRRLRISSVGKKFDLSGVAESRSRQEDDDE